MTDDIEKVVADGGKTTYRYVSLMKASVEIADWGMEDSEKAVFAGKKPEVWMPKVKNAEEDQIIGVRLERVALAKLPDWMPSKEAFEWAYENKPDGFREYYQELTEERK